MSNRFPPQLHLSLPPAATSFKRSFDQFGFDLDSPGLQDNQGASGSGSSSSASTPSTDGNDRNKRARSEPRSTQSTPDLDLSALPPFLDPPRLATPDLPDLDMTTTETTAPLDLNDRLRLSLDRFNAFDTQISVLRASRPRSPQNVRPPSPPPTLPPLSLDNRVHLNELPNPFTFQSLDSAAQSAPYLPFASPVSPQPPDDNNDHDVHTHNDNDIQPHDLQHPEATLDPRDRNLSAYPFRSVSPSSSDESATITPSDGQGNAIQAGSRSPVLTAARPQPERQRLFRDRLDSALDIIRSRSPLFSELHDEDEDDAPLPPRQEAIRFTPLPRIQTQVDDDRDWGVSWLGPSASPPDTYSPLDRFGTHRAPPQPFVETRRAPSPPPRPSPFLARTQRPSSELYPRDYPPPRMNGSVSPNGLTAGFSTDWARPTPLHRGAHGSLGPSSPPSERNGSRSDNARFIANGLLDPREDHDHPLSDPQPAGPHALPRSSTESRQQMFAGDAWDDPDMPDHEQFQRWRSTLRQTMQNRPNSGHEPRQAEWRTRSHSREPQAPPAGLNWRRPLSSFITGAGRDPPDQPLSFSPLRLQFPGSHRRWSRGASDQDQSSENRSAPIPASGSPDGSSSSGDEDDGIMSITRWPVSFEQFDWDTGPSRQPTAQASRPQPAAHPSVPEPEYPLFDFLPSRSDVDTRPTPSRPSWLPQRRPSLPQTNTGSSNDPLSGLYLNLRFDYPSPTESTRRRSGMSEHADSWRPSRLIMTEFEPEPLSARPSTTTTTSTADRSRSLGRDRLPRPPRLAATSPPRVPPFALPASDFSPIFDSFNERMESSSPVSPQSWHHRPFSHEGVFRPPTPPAPVVGTGPRPRQTSPHRLPMPAPMPIPMSVPTGRNTGVYRNAHEMGLGASQDSSFRASLQRFIELDSVRSRLSRLESTAEDEVEGRYPPQIPQHQQHQHQHHQHQHQPPSLPPLRFEADLSPIHVESPSLPTSRYPSSEERRASHSYTRMLERRPFGLSNAAEPQPPPPAPAPAPVPPPSHFGGFRSRPTSLDMMSMSEPRRDPLAMFPPRLGGPWLGSSPPPPPLPPPALAPVFAPLSGPPPPNPAPTRPFEHAVSFSTLRDAIVGGHRQQSSMSQPHQQQQQQQQHQNEESRRWERPVMGWGSPPEGDGDAEPMRQTPWRRRFWRRSVDMRGGGGGGNGTAFPVVEPSTGSSAGVGRPMAGLSGARRRTVSRSPTRDEDTLRERLRMMRPMFRDFRPRFVDEPFRSRQRFSGDYVRDEDFDSSYESLLSLAATLGEVKPRSVPEHVLQSLPTALYRDWMSPESDERCSICLDDYKFVDPVMKLPECTHWLHRDCLKQWLRSASTCPVCRKPVRDPNHTKDGVGSSGGDPGPSSSRGSRFRTNREDEERRNGYRLFGLDDMRMF